MKKNYLFVLISSIAIVVLAYQFQNNLSELKSYGLLGIFFLNLIGSATLFIPAPAIASVIAGGVVYPPFLVAIIAALGSVLGDMVGFAVGYSGRKVFIKNHPGKFALFQTLFHKFGSIMIFVFALIPNPIFDAVGIFAGLFSYSPYKFFAISFAGRLFRNLILAYFGSVL